MVIAGFIGFLALGWFVGLSKIAAADNTDEIAYYEELAKEQYALGGYGSVIKFYEKIISLNDNPPNRIRLADLYLKIENTGKYKSTLEECIAVFPKEPAAYEILAGYYRNNKKYEDCVTVLKQALNGGINSEKVTEMYYNTAFLFNYVSEGYQEAHNYYQNTALVKKEGKYQYLRTENSDDARDFYDEATSVTDSIAGVIKDKEAYYIDQGENKYLGTTEEYDRIWSMNEGKGVWKKGNTYGYINNIFKKTLGTYQNATSFLDGVAAVRNEDQWYLIDQEGNRIGKRTYQNVLVDEDNFCSSQGRIFVSEGEGYYLVDTAGKKQGKALYEDAKPFFKEGLTAVKKDGKWGFADTSGKLVIEPQYEDARPFGYGVAAVKSGGLWGFISRTNRMVIKPQFDDAGCFTENAMAPVKEEENWYYIKIYK